MNTLGIGLFNPQFLATSVRSTYYWNGNRDQAYSLSEHNQFTLVHNRMVVPSDAQELRFDWSADVDPGNGLGGISITAQYFLENGGVGQDLITIDLGNGPTDGTYTAVLGKSVPATWKNQPGYLVFKVAGDTAKIVDIRIDNIRFSSPNRTLSTDAVAENGAPSVALTEIEALAAAAEQQWTAAGASADRLRGLQFAIADLPGSTLAQTENWLITLDADAAGHGWFLDPTPAIGEEFDLAAFFHQVTQGVFLVGDGDGEAREDHVHLSFLKRGKKVGKRHGREGKVDADRFRQKARQVHLEPDELAVLADSAERGLRSGRGDAQRPILENAIEDRAFGHR
jgi:hypothetical protein